MMNVESMTIVNIVACAALTCCCSSSATSDEEQLKKAIPAKSLALIKDLLMEVCPEGTVLRERVGQFRFGCRVASVRTHAVQPNSQIPASAIDVAPRQNGYILELRWFPHTWQGYNRGGIHSPGRHLARDYWCEYLEHGKLPDNGGYLELRWRYGANTDRNVLKRIRSVFNDATIQEEHEVFPNDWTRKKNVIQEQLSAAALKHGYRVKWRPEGDSITFGFKTMDFDIHAIEANGTVAPKSHREMGPQPDGLIVRLSAVTPRLLRQAKPVRGRFDGPYWRHFYSTYDEQSGEFQLDMLYGTKTDTKLLREITDTLDEFYSRPERF